MIKTQELKTQIEELTKQNDMMLTELEQMKRLLADNQSNQSNQSSDGNESQSRQRSGSSGGQQEQNGSEGQKQSQSRNAGSRSQSGGRGSGQEAKLADDLLQIKDLVTKLEEKTSQYVSSQTGGSLTEKDVVNLVLTLINGMVDWASDFVSNQASSSGQKQ